MTDDPGNEPTISPDGRWRWDGANWVPNQNVRPPETSPNPAAKKAMGMGTKVLIGFGAVMAALVLVGAVVSAGGDPAGGTSSEPVAGQSTKPGDPAQASGPMTLQCGPTEDVTSKTQLEQATLSTDGSNLTFTWTANQVPPATADGSDSSAGYSTVSYFATVSDAGTDGDGPSYELSVEFLDGELESYGVLDANSATFTNLPGDLEDESPSKSFTATIPLSSMPDIAGTFQWTAGLALGGPDVSECPAGGEPADFTLPSPKDSTTGEPAAPSAMELVEAKVAEVSARNGDDREPGTVTKVGTDLTIVIPMADNLTNNLILGGFQNDTQAILQVVQDSGIQVKNTTVTGILPLQDKRGNELGERPVSRMTFDDVNDLVLENIIKIEEAADEYWVHPALQ